MFLSVNVIDSDSAIRHMFPKDMIILVYIDDCVLVSRSDDVTKKFIDSLTNGPENFSFTDKRSMDKYLGVDIQKLERK